MSRSLVVSKFDVIVTPRSVGAIDAETLALHAAWDDDVLTTLDDALKLMGTVITPLDPSNCLKCVPLAMPDPGAVTISSPCPSLHCPLGVIPLPLEADQ